MIRNALSGGTTDTAAVKFMRDEAKDLAEIYAAEADNLAKAAEELAAVCQKIDDELKLAQSQKGSRPRLSESGPQDPTSH
jgi:pyridoxal biosynthesis lyase PdxS